MPYQSHSILRLGERELEAHNVSKRYLENLRRESWKGRRGSVERGKTYQENFERGEIYQDNFERKKTYEDNFAARRESFQSKTKSLENCVERKKENRENLSMCMGRVDNPSERKSLENLGKRKILENLEKTVKLPPIHAQETG